jgi:membrane fusion protein (multidrug efflux system)
MPLDLKYSARTRGEREVEVRARISGILMKRYYREGAYVEANALLFKIDPAPYIQEVDRLRALEAVEGARSVDAAAQYERSVALAAKGIISQRDRDAAVAAHAQAAASARAAEAALHGAELNLSYTSIRAPIAGFTGRESRSEGSLVEAGASSSLLTTIVQSDRLYIDFTLPAEEAQVVRAAMRKGPVAVRLAPDGKNEIAQPAVLEFLDSRIDADSGTVAARAVIGNKGGELASGQFVLARIDGLASAPAIYIPVRAVLNTPDGAMVWTVDNETKIQPRPVKLADSLENVVQVTGGLQTGDRIVVDGILKVQPGVTVKPISVDVNDPPGGLTSQLEGAPTIRNE